LASLIGCGGYVHVTRGIMVHMDSEAKLAGEIRHEIGHFTPWDMCKKLSIM
jgi:predicted Zn-dependent protease